MSSPQLPRAVEVLAGVGLLLLLNREAPGVVQAVLVLLVLYALLTNVPRAVELIQKGPNTLASGFAGPASIRSGASRLAS